MLNLFISVLPSRYKYKAILRGLKGGFVRGIRTKITVMGWWRFSFIEIQGISRSCDRGYEYPFLNLFQHRILLKITKEKIKIKFFYFRNQAVGRYGPRKSNYAGVTILFLLFESGALTGAAQGQICQAAPPLKIKPCLRPTAWIQWKVDMVN